MHHPPPPASIATEFVRLHLARFIWSINWLNICLEMRCASVYLSTRRIALKVKLKTWLSNIKKVSCKLKLKANFDSIRTCCCCASWHWVFGLFINKFVYFLFYKICLFIRYQNKQTMRHQWLSNERSMNSLFVQVQDINKN